jgi:branched-chain amino acid transport system substrate-binding protein
MRGSSGRRAAALLLAGLTLGLTACGSDDSASNPSSTAGQSTTGTTEAGAAGDQKVGSGVTDYLAYTGGKAGAADTGKSPITIGWVNQQGGPNDIGPNGTKGIEMAVKYINAELGGIEGHPLQVRSCFISTAEEQGQTCGQKMANDKDVSVVEVGAVATGDQSLVSTIDGDKPMVYSVAVGPSDATNTNGYVLFGDGIHVSGPFGTFAAKVLNAKTAAVVYPDVPGIQQSSKAIVDGATGNGVKVKSVSWSPNATDLVGPLTAAGGQSADAIIANPDVKGCVNLAKAISQLNIDAPVVSEPLCLNSTVAKTLGDLPQWYYGIATSLATDTSDPASVAFMRIAAKYGLAEEGASDVWIANSFAVTLTIAQWMNKIGADEVTPATIAAQAKAFKGPMAYGAPTVQCGKYSDAPAICNDQTKFFKYVGKGKFTPASGWLQPPS